MFFKIYRNKLYAGARSLQQEAYRVILFDQLKKMAFYYFELY